MYTAAHSDVAAALSAALATALISHLMNFNMGKKGRRQAGLEAWSGKLRRKVANNVHHEGQMSELFIGVPQYSLQGNSPSPEMLG